MFALTIRVSGRHECEAEEHEEGRGRQAVLVVVNPRRLLILKGNVMPMNGTGKYLSNTWCAAYIT